MFENILSEFFEKLLSKYFKNIPRISSHQRGDCGSFYHVYAN
jgi:hypothetical protein